MRPVPLGSKRRKFRAQCGTIKPLVIRDKTEEEMKARVAIRFLVKKTKHFDASKKNVKNVSKKRSREEKSSAECLLYLGLEPKEMETQQRKVPKQETQTNFEFPKPKIYECFQCSKFFFHEFLLQKHNALRHRSSSSKRLASKVSRKKQKLIYHKPKSTLMDQRSQNDEPSSFDLPLNIPVGLPYDYDWITTEEIEKLFFDSSS